MKVKIPFCNLTFQLIWTKRNVLQQIQKVEQLSVLGLENNLSIKLTASILSSKECQLENEVA